MQKWTGGGELEVGQGQRKPNGARGFASSSTKKDLSAVGPCPRDGVGEGGEEEREGQGEEGGGE